MNVGQILRDSWRITIHNWPLWLLTAGLAITFVPAFTLGGALGGMAAVVTLPARGFEPEWLARLRMLPAWQIVAGWAAALMVMVLTGALAYLLQAAVIRGAALAAEHGRVSLGAALHLGWRRVLNILGLSLTLGTVILVLGLLPWLGVILVNQHLGPAGASLLHVVQALSSPVSPALGMALFLMLMAFAVEDVRPRAAPGRAWAVFRKGWWAFLLVVGLSLALAIPVVVLALPVALIVPLAFVANRVLGALVGLLCGGGAGLIGAAYLILTFVFTTVLYTLVYRAAARLADAGGPATATPPST
jgi:hypothetical protein